MLFKNQDKNAVKKAVDLSEDQYAIRQHMKERGLIAFVADGAILPRESGISSKPMKHAVAFRSPDSMRVSMKLPHKGRDYRHGAKSRNYVDCRRWLSWKVYFAESIGNGCIHIYPATGGNMW